MAGLSNRILPLLKQINHAGISNSCPLLQNRLQKAFSISEHNYKTLSQRLNKLNLKIDPSSIHQIHTTTNPLEKSFSLCNNVRPIDVSYALSSIRQLLLKPNSGFNNLVRSYYGKSGITKRWLLQSKKNTFLCSTRRFAKKCKSDKKKSKCKSKCPKKTPKKSKSKEKEKKGCGEEDEPVPCIKKKKIKCKKVDPCKKKKKKCEKKKPKPVCKKKPECKKKPDSKPEKKPSKNKPQEKPKSEEKKKPPTCNHKEGEKCDCKPKEKPKSCEPAKKKCAADNLPKEKKCPTATATDTKKAVTYSNKPPVVEPVSVKVPVDKGDLACKRANSGGKPNATATQKVCQLNCTHKYPKGYCFPRDPKEICVSRNRHRKSKRNTCGK